MLTLTILSGSALLLLLVVLGWALARIRSALQGITDSLENIAMGVRAIEQETAPLGSEIGTLNGTFEKLDAGFASIAENLRRLTK